MTAVAGVVAIQRSFRNGNSGSFFAAQWRLEAGHHNVAVHGAGIGQVPSFDAVADKVRLRIKKWLFAPRNLCHQSDP
jgi:hypothetical protein